MSDKPFKNINDLMEGKLFDGKKEEPIPAKKVVVSKPPPPYAPEYYMPVSSPQISQPPNAPPQSFWERWTTPKEPKTIEEMVYRHVPADKLKEHFGEDHLFLLWSGKPIKMFKDAKYSVLEMKELFSFEQLIQLGLQKEHIAGDWNIIAFANVYQIDWLTEIGDKLAMTVADLFSCGIQIHMFARADVSFDAWLKRGLNGDSISKMKIDPLRAKSIFKIESIDDLKKLKFSEAEKKNLRDKCNWTKEAFLRVYANSCDNDFETVMLSRAVDPQEKGVGSSLFNFGFLQQTKQPQPEAAKVPVQRPKQQKETNTLIRLRAWE